MRPFHLSDLTRVRIRFGPTAPTPELREHMIRSTNRFLSLALSGRIAAPRIPRARVDQGGFEAIFRRAGGRALADLFWGRVLHSRRSRR